MKDTLRNEGVYVTKIPCKELELVNQHDFFKIERVNGDCSVDIIQVTQDEAEDLIDQLVGLGV